MGPAGVRGGVSRGSRCQLCSAMGHGVSWEGVWAGLFGGGLRMPCLHATVEAGTLRATQLSLTAVHRPAHRPPAPRSPGAPGTP